MMLFGQPVEPCEDCYEGWCTMNCSPRARRDPPKADHCLMPEPLPPAEAEIYQRFRDLMIKAHCADGRKENCAGKIEITAQAITFRCARCGDARQLIKG